MAGQVQYAQQTDDASRSAFSRIHGNDSTAYYKRDDGKDLPARPFDDIPAGKTEKAKIQTSLIKNEDNSEYGTSGGNDTEDKVFLLSEKEAETLFSDEEERIAKATEYAEKSGVYVNKEKVAWWWLRSPGYHGHHAAVVNKYGWVDRDGSCVSIYSGGVRPALHLNLQS